jgi:SPW repeat
MNMKRLRDLLITLLGLWLMMSPRLLHFATAHTIANWNTWVLGAAVILLTAVSRYLVDTRSPWEDLASAVLGFWLVIAPWALGFSTQVTERSNSVITGCIIAVVALWAMVIDADLHTWVDHRIQQRRILR